jgi:hypothetical protein
MSDSEVLTSLKVPPSLAGNGDKNPKRVTAARGKKQFRAHARARLTTLRRLRVPILHRPHPPRSFPLGMIAAEDSETLRLLPYSSPTHPC